MTTTPIHNLTDTWNAIGTTFNAIKMNVTDTASADASKLFLLQVGGTDVVAIDKSGAFQDSLFALADNADRTKKVQFQVSGVTTGTTRVLTVPNFDGTIATLAGTETFTNKTIDSANNTLTLDLSEGTLTGTTAEFNTALSDDSFATLTNSVTLTNKTVNLASNTLTGTLAEFNTALSDENFVSIGGVETLTNKTLTSPVLNGTITGDAFLDEDNMASDSATKLASQQSTKAYIDNRTADYAVDTVAALKALVSGAVSNGAIILVRGYAAKADGGDRYVKYDSGSSDTANDVTVFTPDTLAGRFIHLGPVWPEHAGVFESAANNTTALQRLADANVDCDFHGGTFAFDTQIDLPADFTAKWHNAIFDISGAGNIKAISGIGADFTTVDAAQSNASATTLSANASQGDTTISCTGGDSSGVSAGDIVLISSTTPWDADTALASEYQIVASQTTGTITLERGLRDEYLTAASAQVLRFASVLSPAFENIHFIGAGGVSSQWGISLYRCINAKLKNISGVFVRERLINLTCDIFTDADGTHVVGADENGLGYGIAASGGWGGSYGDISGRSVRHAFTTGDRGSDVTNTPDYIVTREIQVGNIHVVDALGAPFDAHPGAVDVVVGNVSGSMQTGVSEDCCTLQGARITVGDINITGVENIGVLVQTHGCGDANRENYFKIGTVTLSSDSTVNNNYAAVIQNSAPAGEAISYAHIEGLFSSADRGIILNPSAGDINRFYLGPSDVRGENYDVLSVSDNASYRVKRIVVNGARLEANASSRYPVYFTGNSYTPSPDKFTTIADFRDCELVNLGTGAAMRTLGNALVRFHDCTLSTNGTGDLIADTGGVATIGYNGNTNLRGTISSGAIVAIPDAMLTAAAESGTSDDLSTITLPVDFFDCNGAYDANDMASLFIRCRVRPDSGDTITLKHAASGANTIRCPWGQDLVLSDRAHVAELVFMHDLAQWVVVAFTKAAQSAITSLTDNTGVTHDDTIADIGAITALTDSSGGATDGTIAAVSGSGADTDVNNNFAELAAVVAQLKTAVEALEANDSDIAAKVEELLTAARSDGWLST